MRFMVSRKQKLGSSIEVLAISVIKCRDTSDALIKLEAFHKEIGSNL